MKTFCIIPCGSKKIWSKYPCTGPTKAKNVYIGPFAKTCKEYAENFYPDSWCILSAKYGFLFPDDIVPESYNVSFNDKGTNPISLKELKEQLEEKGIRDFDCFVVLGGKNYVKKISDLLPDRDIHNPLEGCKGIGYMIGIMKKALKEQKSL